MSAVIRRLSIVGGLLMGMFSISGAKAQTPADVDRSTSNLMVVLRESHGANKQDEVLRPSGRIKAVLPDGKEVEMNMAWFDYLGDMHIRFVFDSPSFMRNASPDDLQRLKLTPEVALKLAVENMKRVYGKPHSVELSAPIMDVESKAPDLNSSYFLDLEFWKGLSKQHPEGIVAAPVKRGGLLYVPLSEAKVVDALRKSVGHLYETSGNMRVSSALYLFKDGHWSVFQAPVAK